MVKVFQIIIGKHIEDISLKDLHKLISEIDVNQSLCAKIKRIR